MTFKNIRQGDNPFAFESLGHWAKELQIPARSLLHHSACGHLPVFALPPHEVDYYAVHEDSFSDPLPATARAPIPLGGRSHIRRKLRWIHWPRWTTITDYEPWNPTGGPRIGHLPQGAPTSPMLANLAVVHLDEDVAAIAKKLGLTYTRYADDLILSTDAKEFSREKAKRAVGQVTAALGKWGLGANSAKTSVSPPGSRKIALGLALEGPAPRLPRHFKEKLRAHLFYLENRAIGPVGHARARGFTSVIGLRNHLQGLAAFAAQIEPAYGADIKNRLEVVDWPL